MPKKDKRHRTQAEKAELNARRERMEADVARMARTANRRLRQLEQANLTTASNAYRYIKKRHFDKDSAIAEDRSGHIKFDTALKKKTAQQLQHEKAELERFLYEAQTSTVKGTMSRYTRAFEAYKKNHPEVSIDRSEFDMLVSTAGFQAFVDAFGSDDVADLFNAAMDEPNMDFAAALENFTQDMSLQEFYDSVPFGGNVNNPEDSDIPI